MMFGVGFRAAGIQSYILSGGALKDIAAGSEMIERLCTRDLAAGLAACGLPEKCIHFAAAGGFHLVGLEETEARRFARVWSLMEALLLAGCAFPPLSLVGAGLSGAGGVVGTPME